MTEHDIVAKAEKQVKEWIDYAKQEYGWEDKTFELFEEPMIEVATSVAVQTIKDLQKDNKDLREKVHFWKKEVNVANRNAVEEYSELKIKYDNLNAYCNRTKSIIDELLGCLGLDDSYSETAQYIEKCKTEAQKFLKEQINA